jgi:hypothetical protein
VQADARVEVSAATPVRGMLRLETKPWRRSEVAPLAITTIATLVHEDRGGPLLRLLRDARVKTLKGEQFLVIGLQFVDVTYPSDDPPQAWWCRLVSPDDYSDILPPVSTASVALRGGHDRGNG